MLVWLARPLFAGGNRYKVDSNGVEMPDDIELPQGAKVWDGKQFVALPEDVKKREAMVAKSAKAKLPEEEEFRTVTTYDPRYKGPNTMPSTQGKVPVEPQIMAGEKHPPTHKQR